MNKPKTAVLICSDIEWEEVKNILAPAEISLGIFGEHFEYHNILFFQTGWTKTVAAAGTQFVIDTYKPEQLINIGTCGGFAGHTAVGDILLAHKTIVYDLYERMGDPEAVIIGIEPQGEALDPQRARKASCGSAS